MITVLGIDPALNKLGYSILSIDHNDNMEVSEIGHINSSKFKTEEEKVRNIISVIYPLIKAHKIDLIAIENQFVKINPKSSLSLSMVKGVILSLASIENINIIEVSATAVKKYTTGNGKAEKDQMANFLKMMFPKVEFKTYDESDALAIAFTGHLMQKNKYLS